MVDESFACGDGVGTAGFSDLLTAAGLPASVAVPPLIVVHVEDDLLPVGLVGLALRVPVGLVGRLSGRGYWGGGVTEEGEFGASSAFAAPTPAPANIMHAAARKAATA